MIYIDLLAKWMFIADQRSEVECWMEEDKKAWTSDEVNNIIIDQWNNYLKALNEEPWKDGKHEGDCTTVPMTCIRCLVERYYKCAKEEVEKLFNESSKKMGEQKNI